MSVQFGFDFDRALAAMVYIASKRIADLTTYKLCKLIFLSDKLHLVRFGRPITGDSLRAMDYGPVPSEVYDVLKGFVAGYRNARVDALDEHLAINRHYQHPRFEMVRDINFPYFLSASEIQALNEVIAAHGSKNFDELYALTHAMPAYVNAWEQRGSSRNPLMSFEELFINDSEAIAGTEEEMLEDYEMRRALDAV